MFIQISMLALIVVVLTIYSGFYLLKKNNEKSEKKLKRALKINVSAFLPVILMFLILLIPESSKAASSTQMASDGLKYIGAALSTGFATIGSGYAVGAVGQAALGAISEDQSILGKTIIFVGLAEGIAIFGLIISILILYA